MLLGLSLGSIEMWKRGTVILLMAVQMACKFGSTVDNHLLISHNACPLVFVRVQDPSPFKQGIYVIHAKNVNEI